MPTKKILVDYLIDGKLQINNVANQSGSILTLSSVDGKTITKRTLAETVSDLGVQPVLSGTGFVKSAAGVISYDNTAYLPLTGGTVTGIINANGTNATPIALTRTGTTTNLNISFTLGGVTKYLGVNANAGDLYFGTSADLNNPSFGNKVWHSGNDGTGSTLDADLLDGLEASAFALSAHTHNSLVTASITDANADRGAGFFTMNYTTGSTNFPTAVGAGIEYRRSSGGTSDLGSFQLVSSNTNDNNLYFRKITGYSAGDVWSTWGTIWTNVNDGVGSGLDADLLDGQQGSYYLDIANLTGTLPISKGGTGQTTASLALTALGGFPTSAGGALDVNAANGTKLYAGSSISWTNRGPAGSNAGALFSINTHPGDYYSQLWFDTTGGSFYHRTSSNALPTAAWNKVWTSNNDGAGSGLDADMLDGLHATSSNVINSVVSRDASGNFSAGSITASLSGNATTATSTPQISTYDSTNTDITALVPGTAAGTWVKGLVNGHVVVTIDGNDANDSFNILSNTNLVAGGAPMTTNLLRILRGGQATFLGSVTAPTFIGNLTGNADTATKLTPAIPINGVSFDGSVGINIPSLYDSNYKRITNPGGAEYATGAPATQTGAIAIILPVGYTSTMMRLTIKVFDYASGESFDVICGGYNYSATPAWLNTFAYISAQPGIDRRFTVRFGYTAGAKMVIYIGELSSVWNYPQVYVTDVQLGYTGQSVTWTSGWSVGFQASAFENVTATQTNTQIGFQASTNTANSVVLRDGSGNFSAGTITATLVGNATNVTGIVAAANGGTGQSTYIIGDLLYASSTTALSRLAGVAVNNVLISGGVGAAPSWNKVGLTTHVSGILPIANGGTNSSAVPTLGGVAIGTGTGYTFTGIGIAGQYLKSNVAALPTWETLSLMDIPASSYKDPVKAATTADLAAASFTSSTLTGTLVVLPAQDGITLNVGDRLLVKNQTLPAQNGIYAVTVKGVAGTTAWVLTRSEDANIASELSGGTVNVDSGTVNGGVLFSTSLKSTDVIGTTAVNWYKVLDSGDLITVGSTSVGAVKYNGITSAIGNFDGGTSDPTTWTGTNRLNYNGYLWTRYLNIAGTADTATAATHYFVEQNTDGYVRPKTLADVKTEIVTSASVIAGLGYTPSNVATTVPATTGGTGQSSYVIGDLLYASSTTALSRLAGVAVNNVLISGGVGVAPSWGKIALTTHVSGILPIANGGTNASTTPTLGAIAYGTGTAYGFSAVGTVGQYLKSNAGAIPTWQSLTMLDLPDASLKKSVVVASTADIGASLRSINVLTGYSPTQTLNVTTTASSATATTTSTAGIKVGAVITGNVNITDGTTVLSITNATTFVMSDVALTAGTTIATTFTQTIAALAIDGYTLLLNDRVLLKDQTTVGGINVTANANNGIYSLTTLGTTAIPWVLTRTADADSIAEICSAFVAVDRGTVNGGRLFDNVLLITNTLGTTAMPWYRIADSGTVVTYNGTVASAGMFDGGVTTPTATTRLNYGGNFYPTSINLVGTADTVVAASHYYVETATDGVVRPKTLANVKTEIVTKAAIEAVLTGAITTHTHSYLPINDAPMTGTPTAPTAAVGTNTTQVATTAFVTNAVIQNGTITTAVSITNATLTSTSQPQNGKTIYISNGANNINYTVNGDITASFVKGGTGTITFVQGSGRTLVGANGTLVFNGALYSTASIVSFGTLDILYINNL